MKIEAGISALLTPLEQRIACQWAAESQIAWGWDPSPHTVDKSTEDWQKKVNGFGAELAFCRLLGMYPDFTASRRSGGCDYYLGIGTRIEIRSTPGRFLVARKGKDTQDPPDFFILMGGRMPSFTFLGCATPAALISPENWGDHFRKGTASAMCYAMRNDRLCQIFFMDRHSGKWCAR